MAKQLKIDLFIVEGPSDEAYLNPLKKHVEAAHNSALKFRITHGDICQNISSSHKSKIINKIHDHVDSFLKENHLVASDIRKIIHIVDIDAVCSDSNSISENKRINHIKYYRDRIEAIDKNSIINRNSNKCKILQILSSYTQPVAFKESNIPYSIYYFSQNIDDVLSNKLNSTSEEKEIDSINFAIAYNDDFEAFKSIIYENGCINMSKRDSWLYILSMEHAFEKKTNLNILIDEYINENII